MTNEEFDHITKEKLQNYTATVPSGFWEKIRLPNISSPADPFDTFIKEKLHNTVSTVPEDMWNRIKPTEADRKRFFFFLPRTSMVAASLLFLIISGSVSAYLYYHQIQLKQKAIENNSVNQESPSTNNTELKSKNKIDQTHSISPINNNEKIVTPNSTIQTELIPSAIPNGNEATTMKEKPVKKSISLHNYSISKIMPNKIRTIPFNSMAINANKNEVDETAYLQTTKFDAVLIGSPKKVSLYNSGEKEIVFKNHAGTIKNVVICPSDRKIHNTNWDFDLYASPDYTFKTVTNNHATQQFMNRKDSSEKARIGFSAGFRIVKPINDHFSIKTGLNYTQINEAFTYKTENELKTTTVITVRNITLANGTTIVVSDTSILQQLGFKTNTVKNRYKSIDIPILLGYQFGNDNLHVGINAGLMVNVSAWYKGVFLDTALTATTITKENNVVYKNNIGLGIYTGISITKRINYNTLIFAEPYLRYNLSNMTTPQSIYNQRMSIGGLAIGLKFNLNNQ